MIDSFEGDYRWLSNFATAPVELDGVLYPTVEHAYQAAKTLDIHQRYRILDLTAGQAKRYGRRVTLREDWDDIKLDIMQELLEHKFSITLYKNKLLATGCEEIVEGNTWGDTFWGVCNGEGRNELGKLIMRVREKLRNGP